MGAGRVSLHQASQACARDGWSLEASGRSASACADCACGVRAPAACARGSVHAGLPPEGPFGAESKVHGIVCHRGTAHRGRQFAAGPSRGRPEHGCSPAAARSAAAGPRSSPAGQTRTGRIHADVPVTRCYAVSGCPHASSAATRCTGAAGTSAPSRTRATGKNPASSREGTRRVYPHVPGARGSSGADRAGGSRAIV